jgi:peptide-methionine (S)-S-oxide reductase
MSDIRELDMEIATLAGGCFWCLEAVFDQLKGVESVESGYMGGKTPIPPTRRSVGATRPRGSGARDLRPAVITFGDLLGVFFASTTPPRSTARATTSAPSTARPSSIHSPEQERVARTGERLTEESSSAARS